MKALLRELARVPAALVEIGRAIRDGNDEIRRARRLDALRSIAIYRCMVCGSYATHGKLETSEIVGHYMARFACDDHAGAEHVELECAPCARALFAALYQEARP